MVRILFVCHGNICRSPMAEYVMGDLIRQEGLNGSFQVASAATSSEEIGSGVYPPVRAFLSRAGIDSSRHKARQITLADYTLYDMIVAMDSYNVRSLYRLFGGDPQRKISLLLSHLPGSADTEIADPWYTRNFRLTWDQVNRSCKALLEKLLTQTD